MESGDNPEKPDNSRGYGLLSAKRTLEYPNFQEDDGNYILNKMFADESIGDDDSVFVEIFEVGSDYIEVFNMEKNNGYYFVEMPQYSVGTELKFQFSIVRNGRSNSYFPNESYKFLYGSLDIVRYTDKVIPQNFTLYQNYPNPFNSSTTIIVDLPEPTNLKIKIYDILGREVKTLFNGNKLQGEHYFFWNGNNNFGNRVATGVYIYRISTSDFTSVQKMILLN